MLRHHHWIVPCAIALAALVVYPARAATDDEVRAALTRLEQRLDRLEAENESLRQRNDALERRVAELEPAPATPPAVTATPAPPATTVASAPPMPAAAPAGVSEDKAWYERIRVSGYVFGDAYAVLAQHDPAIDDQSGFWIRRGYLTFDAQVADDWSARLRFEVNSPGDFTTNGKLDPYVKDAYLAWKHGGQEVGFGLAATPTFDYVENFWGERPLEKTPLDLYRYGSSRDTGVAYKVKTVDGRIFSHLMLGNGSGDGSETNKGKKAMGAIGFRPLDPLVLQLYADHEDRTGQTDRTTWGAFAGWTAARARYGLQYAYQQRETEDAGHADVSVASAFGVWKLTEHGQLIARYDRNFDGYPDASRIAFFRFADDMKFDLAILGWEQKLERRISLIPNLEYVTYRETDGRPAPRDDLYGKLTLYFEF